MGERMTAAVVIIFLAGASAVAQSESQLAGTVRDAAGQPMAGILVEISSPALAEAVRPVATDSRGRYRFVGLPTGTYAITFTLIGFWTDRREGIQLPNRARLPFSVRLYGDVESDPPAIASGGAGLSGTVFDDRQGVIPSVAVSVTGPATRMATTDGSGQFSFTKLPAGDYELRAALEGFGTTVRKVSFGPGTRLTLRLEMSVGGPRNQAVR
jgi:hypothetical protein